MHKTNVRIRIHDVEYTTTLVYDKDAPDNILTFKIANLPITTEITEVDLYGPKEYYTFAAFVMENTINETTNKSEYRFILSEEQMTKIHEKENSYECLVWYKTQILDGRSLDYRQIFTHFHGALRYLDNENTELKTKLRTLEHQMIAIKSHIGLQ